MKGYLCPLAPPGKGKRGRLPLLPSQFRRPCCVHSFTFLLTLFSKTELKCLIKRYAFTLDHGNCPPGYLNIMNKCLWLMCGGSSPTYAEYRCSRTFGTLASLDGTVMTRLGGYLDHIKARSIGITQVSYVLKSEPYYALSAHTLR